MAWIALPAGTRPLDGVEEAAERLGGTLRLPRQHEHLRDVLKGRLEPLDGVSFEPLEGIA